MALKKKKNKLVLIDKEGAGIPRREPHAQSPGAVKVEFLGTNACNLAETGCSEGDEAGGRGGRTTDSSASSWRTLTVILKVMRSH